MKIRPFKGIRPVPEHVKRIACRPYDVLNSTEAREELNANPETFLQVVKPEITLPEEIDHYDERVYQAADQNFKELVRKGIFIQDNTPCLYIYELTMNGRSQDGIVACASVEDYMNDRIKKHELTRPDKENDRKNHVRYSMINAEPVFFAYKAVNALDKIVNTCKQAVPDYNFIAEDQVKRLLPFSSHGKVCKFILSISIQLNIHLHGYVLF